LIDETFCRVRMSSSGAERTAAIVRRSVGRLLGPRLAADLDAHGSQVVGERGRRRRSGSSTNPFASTFPSNDNAVGTPM
jgi:hypothetical protein